MGFRLVVLALRMLMRRLMMVMSGSLVSGSSVVMMIAGRMLGRLSHLIFLFLESRSLRSRSPQDAQHRSGAVVAEPGLFGFRHHSGLGHELGLAHGHLLADSDYTHLRVLDFGK